MTRTLLQEPEQLVGGIEAPCVTPLGTLDDDGGDAGAGLDATAPKPVLAIIYPGV
ncbi:hypothetical protein SK571_40505 [Lentzea sp. BCCO 10_0798]|uniref:Uncharacterized protein n=1 Tax=Lentzea kristufekii TaxID=3095430 RepID=A0ABU4U6R7_9PSEU|nr:hypothetical protein [Lentzea sp. BCCO 10_0798]MDX8055696.1 hypothetical protein [Lentzea sp. BCCO 10_0798]